MKRVGSHCVSLKGSIPTTSPEARCHSNLMVCVTSNRGIPSLSQ
ncbi:hypothetical protein PZJ0206_16 [Enterobacter phage PZJ0206]|uniref:Uncharacterized protein n=2 Tax=Berlinvirus TaxID=2732677 RepID=A0AAE8YHB3_9CAUD|nr:hypothetical protein PZJ0206_16 [Enterobacter phage PZJ0206]UEW68697.1 hypothetical protein vBSEqdws315_30 [Enterobacter phage vB_SEqdws-315]